jgi:transposase-like protein
MPDIAIPTAFDGASLPSQIISHAMWLYHRFTRSFRDIEELLAARGITVIMKLSAFAVISSVKVIVVKLGRGEGN